MRKTLPIINSQLRPKLPLRIVNPLITNTRCHATSSDVDTAHQVRIREGMASPNTVGLPRETEVGNKRFADFDLMGRTFIVTGGAQGLGLATAEALVEAGARGMLVSRKDTISSRYLFDHGPY